MFQALLINNSTKIFGIPQDMMNTVENGIRQFMNSFTDISIWSTYLDTSSQWFKV